MTDEKPVHRCDICGDTFSTFRNMRVHQTKHQFRACKFCNEPYSANSIRQHEKFCKARLKPTDNDCDVAPLRHLLAPSGEGSFEEVCRFLEAADHIPNDPEISLIVLPDRAPMFCKTRTIGVVIHQLGPNGAMVIPTNALQLQYRPSKKEPDHDH